MIFRLFIKEMNKFLGSILSGVGFGIGLPIGIGLYFGGSLRNIKDIKDINKLPPTTEISLKDFKNLPPIIEV